MLVYGHRGRHRPLLVSPKERDKAAHTTSARPRVEYPNTRGARVGGKS